MHPDRNSSANAYHDLIEKHCIGGRGGRVAVRCEGLVYSYADLRQGALAAAVRLGAIGVHPEQRVALLLDDSPEFMYWFLGALYYGAVPVPLNTFGDGKLLHFYLNDSRARVLVAHQNMRGAVMDARGRGTPYLVHVIWAEDEVYNAPVGRMPGLFASNSDDVALWLYTSGSTSRPKAAIHRHAGLVEVCKNYGRHVLAIGPGDVVYSTSKLFFAYGLGNSLLFPLYAGASSVLVRGKSHPDAVFEVLRRYRPSLFFAVPSLYNLMADNPDCDADTLSSVRLCVSAGENLPESVLRKWRKSTGKTILDGIGSTEAAHIFCSNTADSVIPGSSGRPVPGYELRILNDEGHEVVPGEVGQLLVRGGSIAKGYWNRHDLTLATFRGEWLATGDLFRQDEAGQYMYMGRNGDVFKVSGQWVSPVEIEQLLLAHNEVAEAAVIGVPDGMGLTQARAFVVQRKMAVNGDEGRFKKNLIDYLCEYLPKYKVPSDITSITALPKTATGKVDRGALRNTGPITAVS